VCGVRTQPGPLLYVYSNTADQQCSESEAPKPHAARDKSLFLQNNGPRRTRNSMLKNKRGPCLSTRGISYCPLACHRGSTHGHALTASRSHQTVQARRARNGEGMCDLSRCGAVGKRSRPLLCALMPVLPQGQGAEGQGQGLRVRQGSQRQRP
jgi:hypothetical protein